MFLCSRKRANGNFVNDEAKDLSEKLTEKMSQNMGNASDNMNDEFSQVFGAERSGRVRCVGLGPTPSTYFKNHRSSKTNEAEVVGLRNRVHVLEGKLEKMNDLEAKLEKMNDLEDKLEKMSDVLNRLANSDWN